MKLQMEDEMNRRTILTMLATIPGLFGFIASKPAAALHLDAQEHDRRRRMEKAKRILPCEARVDGVGANRCSDGKWYYYINAKTAEGATFLLDLSDGESHPFVSKLVAGEPATVIITETEWNFPALGVTIETVGHQPGLYRYGAKGNLNEAA